MLRTDHRVPRGRVLLGLLVAVGVVGCGGSMTSPGRTTTGGSPNPGPAPLTSSVGVQDFAFAPGVDTVKAGTAVTWTNYGTVAHTVTSDAAIWNSGQLSAASGGGTDVYGNPTGMSPAGTFQRIFTTAGTYTYHCANHPYMTGTVVVTP